MSVELPTCEMSQLGDIAEVLTRCLSVSCQRQCVALTIEQEGYIPKLLELFHMCEDLDDTKGLHHLFDIFSALFLLNQPALLSIMLHEEIIMDVIGCLEYNPSKPELQKHREFVESSAKFHEVVPIKNSELLSKIHLLYKVLYVKEVILPTPSVFEEHVMAALNSFIRFTKVDIVSGLQVCQLHVCGVCVCVCVCGWVGGCGVGVGGCVGVWWVCGCVGCVWVCGVVCVCVCVCVWVWVCVCVCGCGCEWKHMVVHFYMLSFLTCSKT